MLRRLASLGNVSTIVVLKKKQKKKQEHLNIGLTLMQELVFIVDISALMLLSKKKKKNSAPDFVRGRLMH